MPLDVCVSDDAMDCRHNLFKSLSDTDLTAEAQSTCTEQTQEEDPEAEADKATQCPANEREETESSDDSATQYSIHPPLDFPYFLLLQGFSYRQVGQTHTISVLLLPLAHFTAASVFPPAHQTHATLFLEFSGM